MELLSCEARDVWLSVIGEGSLNPASEVRSPPRESKIPKSIVEVNGIRVLADVLPATKTSVALCGGRSV